MKQRKFIRSSAHLPVKNLQKTLEYYREQLGFYEEWTLGEKDGGIRRDDMRLLFGEDPDFISDLNNSKHRLPLVWFVENIDEVYAEFKERNIEIAEKLTTQPYDVREFSFVDINGYYIRVAEGFFKK